MSKGMSSDINGKRIDKLIEELEAKDRDDRARSWALSIMLVLCLAFWGIFFTYAFGGSWTPECEKQFQESIDKECERIKCLPIDVNANKRK